MAKALFYHCEKCGEDKALNGFFKTKNILMPTGITNICRNCVENILRDNPNDLNVANHLCAWANIPFDPNEWTSLYEVNKQNTFNVYHGIHATEEREDFSWVEANKMWVEYSQQGTLLDNIQVCTEERHRELVAKWGENYDDEQLAYLEQLYQGILQTQNISGKLQIDQALKICKISLLIDEKIRGGENFKDLLTSYDKMIETADFTPKNTKNANDFDSAGEIFAYLEKTGWKNTYYDDVPKDIVDKTMKNIQSWLRHLYINETGIAEDIEHKIEALKTAKELENQIDNSIDEVDKYENEAYDIELNEEEFLAEV